MLTPIRDLLRQYDIRPRKRLGQNFLIDPGALSRIVQAAEVSLDDTVLEIGAGLGTLTAALAQCAHRVIAVEVDERLVAVLRRELASYANVQLVVGDILEQDLGAIIRGDEVASPVPYKVVANIPYYITSAVLRYLLEAACKPQLIVLTVQKEVVERIMARPGEMSLLAVSVQFYGTPAIAARIPASAFYPIPKVDSAVVRIVPHPSLPLDETEIESFFAVVRAGFRQRRKQLRNSLVHGLGLSEAVVLRALSMAGIDPQRRPQTLSVAEWLALYHALHSAGIRWMGEGRPMAAEREEEF